MTLADRIRQVSPFGPVVAGELRSGSRRIRTYVLRVVYLGLLLLVLLFMWSFTAGLGRGQVSVAELAQQQAELGEVFFATFSIFSVIAMALICPILTSNAINDERRRKTLGVLLITPISAWQIVSGKLFSRLLTAMWLLGLSLPVVALVRLEGSIEFSQIAIGIALAVATAISCGAMGLMYSGVIDQPAMVILQSYLTLGCVYGITAVLGSVWTIQGRSPFLGVLGINPVVQIIGLLDSRMMMQIGIGWVGCILFQLGFALAMLFTSAWRLRRDVMRGDILDGITAGQARKARKLARKSAKGPAMPPPLPSGSLFTENTESMVDSAAVAPAPVESMARLQTGVVDPAPIVAPSVSSARPVGDWPVLWREWRVSLFGRRRNAIRLIVFMGLALFTGYVISDWRELNSVQEGFAFLFHTVVGLAAAVVSATIITQEKESGTWPLLIATPISGMQIVLSKVAGVGRRLLMLTMLMLVHFFLIGPVLAWLGFRVPGLYGGTWLSFQNGQDIPEIINRSAMAIFVIVSFNSVWVATGIWFSQRFSRTTTAVVCNLLLILVVYAGVPMILGITDNLLTQYARYDDFSDKIRNFMPYSYLDQIFDSFNYTTISFTDSFTTTNFVAWTCYVGFVHMAIATLILTQCANVFDRVTGRAPQNERLAKSANRVLAAMGS